MPSPLVEELEEDILLRFPPEDPAALVRAALVCKRWRRLISGHGFRRRFREFHRTPPMLGMFCSNLNGHVDSFVPTTAFRPHHAERAHKHLVVDARHGRVLLHGEGETLVVWDPITDEEWEVPFPRVPPQYRGSTSWAAAVLCSSAGAGGGCDHLDCHHGPFIVVLVRTVFGDPRLAVTLIWTYSSDAAAWSEPTFGHQEPVYQFNLWMRSVLVGNTLYFEIMGMWTALKYNVQSRQMLCIRLPSLLPRYQPIVLTTTEDGRLLLAGEYKSKLYVWSRKDDTWEQSRVIELKMLLPIDSNFTSLSVVGSTDDRGIIFTRAGDVVYAIDLKTCKGKKVYEGGVRAIVLFMSFYTPELGVACAGEGPSESGGSSSA